MTGASVTNHPFFYSSSAGASRARKSPLEAPGVARVLFEAAKITSTQLEQVDCVEWWGFSVAP